MPQMKPLNWMTLFIAFSLIMLMKIMLNFFNKKYYFNYYNKLNTNYNSLNWKW